jgi:D-xylose transport system substrate-binding protein
MKKVTVLLLALSLIFSCGCASDQNFKNDDNQLKIGFIYETMTVERWQRDRDIFVSEAEKLGATVFVMNAYEDSERQIEIGKEMVDQGMDVLVIVAYDKDALTELVRYAHSHNVKVIAYDRLIRNADVDLYISFDNRRVGELMGKTAAASVPKGNYLILNGTKKDNNSSQLHDGYYGVLQPYIDRGSIKVVGETWVEAWRDEVSYQYVSEKLKSGIKFEAVIAANDRLAEGAVNALSEKMLAGEVFVTGQDAELAACQRIVEGTQSMTVYKPISVLAKGAAELAVKLAGGDDIGHCDKIWDGTYDVDCIYYEPILVTKDNIVDTVIEGGFYTLEQVYANIPESQWPAASGG